MATLSQITPTIVDTILPPALLERPIRLGRYQIDVLVGNQAWSGADLRGAAKNYSARYARSRRSALAKVQRALAGTVVDLTIATRARGKLVLEWTIAGMTLPQYRAACEHPGLAGMVTE